MAAPRMPSPPDTGRSAPKIVTTALALRGLLFLGGVLSLAGMLLATLTGKNKK